MRLQALLLQLGRHLGFYVELGAAAATEYHAAWVRRMVLMVLGAAAGIVGLGALWTAGLLALWQSRWLLPYAVVSAVVLLILSALALYGALIRSSSGPASRVLKSELHKDLELFQEWKRTI